MKEKINKLITAINNHENDPEMRDMYNNAVKSMLRSCSKYIHLVVNQEQRIQMAHFRMENDEFREYVINLDSTRRYAHESLMSEINVCNRLCEIVGVEPIAPDVAKDDRETYSVFAMKVVEEYFEEKLTH